MGVRQLREQASLRGISEAGSKRELVERICADIEKDSEVVGEGMLLSVVLFGFVNRLMLIVIALRIFANPHTLICFSSDTVVGFPMALSCNARVFPAQGCLSSAESEKCS